MPCAVPQNDVADLEMAMRRCEESTTRPISDNEAWNLLKSPNYYLWAMGVYTLSANPTSQAAGIFPNELGTSTDTPPVLKADKTGDASHRDRRVLSPRQAVWITYCLRDIVPGSVRPSSDVILAELLDYLENSSQYDKSGFVP